MNEQSLIGFLVIGLLAGWIAGQLMRGGSFGLVGNLVVGVIGAVIGGLVFNLVGVTTGGFVGSLITAVLGAAMLLYLVGLIPRR